MTDNTQSPGARVEIRLPTVQQQRSNSTLQQLLSRTKMRVVNRYAADARPEMKILQSLTAAIAIALVFSVNTLQGQQTRAQTVEVNLDKLNEQHPQNVKTEIVTYKGTKALRVSDTAAPDVHDGIQLVVLDKTQFRDGTIQIEMTGEPRPGAVTNGPRGFVGLAFRLHMDDKDVPNYECFYIRPTNGRADDQLRRNHATQYISYPARPFFKLREEKPGVYESYADMVAGEWTKVKITVSGNKAQLYVGDAPQPVLIVNDLTQTEGKIALWVGTETIAHFAHLRVTPGN